MRGRTSHACLQRSGPADLGRASKPSRLPRIAEHIAESANNNRNLVRNRDAVADWRNDLDFLKAKYAEAHIQWPRLPWT
jgi:hypothetical protein